MTSEVVNMDKEMQDKIKKQLDYIGLNRLFCNHNKDKVCDDCRKRFTGEISPELTGNISPRLTGNISRLTGNISGIKGKVEDIIQILAEK